MVVVLVGVIMILFLAISTVWGSVLACLPVCFCGDQFMMASLLDSRDGLFDKSVKKIHPKLCDPISKHLTTGFIMNDSVSSFQVYPYK